MTSELPGIEPREAGRTSFAKAILAWTVGVVVFGALYLTSRYSFLLFHTLAELFSIVIGTSIFMIAWNARRLMQNSSLLLIGVAFLFIALLDLTHTLTYKGMGLFEGIGADPPTQLWIAARFLQAISLLIAPLFLGRTLPPNTLVLLYAVISGVVLLAIFVWDVFPVCFVEGSGLTRFKRNAEYVICLLLAGAMISFWVRREQFDKEVLSWMLWAIGLTILSELVFTTYVSLYGTFNMIGHMLKILATYMVYRAIIETGFSKPQRLLLRKATQSEERYRLLFDLSPDAVFSVDTEGRFLVVNPACEIVSGYTAAELRGKTFMDICAPDCLKETMEAFKKGLADPRYAHFETALIRKDGKRVELWIAGKPLVSDGKPVAVYCAARDIGERKRFQADLERLVKERTARLEELVQELEHFSYSITHDMRAPLRAMRGFAGLLQETAAEKLPSQSAHFLQLIMKSAQRMDRLITDALQYNNTVTKTFSLTRVNTGGLVQDIINSYPNMHQPDADVRVDGPLPDVLANEAGLTQCISNLLSNAVQFVTPGKLPVVRVRADIRKADSNTDSKGWAHSKRIVRIWVEDNGIGISQNSQRRLFRMFERLSSNQEGTGIGLALVRKVAERMNGHVGVESELGKGSRFWIELPAAD